MGQEYVQWMRESILRECQAGSLHNRNFTISDDLLGDEFP